MAARNAALTIKERMIDVAAKHGKSQKSAHPLCRAARFHRQASRSALASWPKACKAARVSLSSTGFYATPVIHWDRANGRGHPFFYFAYGASCSEVTVDTLTGEMKVTAWIFFTMSGTSLNPAIDIGQIEGGFVQGMGWLTTEELVFDARASCAPMHHQPTKFPAPRTCRRISV